jgi:hypothetical protein
MKSFTGLDRIGFRCLASGARCAAYPLPLPSRLNASHPRAWTQPKTQPVPPFLGRQLPRELLRHLSPLSQSNDTSTVCCSRPPKVAHSPAPGSWRVRGLGPSGRRAWTTSRPTPSDTSLSHSPSALGRRSPKLRSWRGTATPPTTARVYSHSLGGEARQVAEKVSAPFEEATSAGSNENVTQSAFLVTRTGRRSS